MEIVVVHIVVDMTCFGQKYFVHSCMVNTKSPLLVVKTAAGRIAEHC